MNEENFKKYEVISNILYINMWGEAQRNNNTIYIKNVKDNMESELCITMALAVNHIHNVNIVLEVSLWNYLKFIKKYDYIFRKKPFKRVRKLIPGRNAEDWLYDISDAQGAPREIWKEIWEYINEDYNE